MEGGGLDLAEWGGGYCEVGGEGRGRDATPASPPPPFPARNETLIRW